MSMTIEANGSAPTIEQALADAGSRYDATLYAPTDPPAAEGDDTAGLPEGEAEEAGGEAPKPEPAGSVGLSPHLMRAAIQADIPQSMIDLARDDAQLAEIIAMVGPPDREPATDPIQQLLGELAAPEIPEDSFDETDPLHVTIRDFKAKHDKTLNVLERLLRDTGGLVAENKQSAEARLEDSFDAGIDGLGHENHAGKPGSPNRAKAYPLYRILLDMDPKADPAEVAKRAYYATFPDVVTGAAKQKQLDAITQQQQTKLGGGPAKPAPARQLTRDEELRAKLKPFIDRARAAGR